MRVTAGAFTNQTRRKPCVRRCSYDVRAKPNTLRKPRRRPFARRTEPSRPAPPCARRPVILADLRAVPARDVRWKIFLRERRSNQPAHLHTQPRWMPKSAWLAHERRPVSGSAIKASRRIRLQSEPFSGHVRSNPSARRIAKPATRIGAGLRLPTFARAKAFGRLLTKISRRLGQHAP